VKLRECKGAAHYRTGSDRILDSTWQTELVFLIQRMNANADLSASIRSLPQVSKLTLTPMWPLATQYRTGSGSDLVVYEMFKPAQEDV